MLFRCCFDAIHILIRHYDACHAADMMLMSFSLMAMHILLLRASAHAAMPDATPVAVAAAMMLICCRDSLLPAIRCLLLLLPPLLIDVCRGAAEAFCLYAAARDKRFT